MTRVCLSPMKVLTIGLAAAYAITVHGSTLLSGKEVPRGGLSAKSHRHDGSTVQTSRDEKNDANIHQVLKSNTAPIVHEERIVGGHNVAKEAFPWYVSSTGDMYCGASLIHEDVVLTAAHCFQAFKPGSVVTLGTHQRVPPDMVQEIEATGITRKITAVIGHPKYDDFNILYDYMLLRLDSPVKSVTPVELNTDEAVPAAGEMVTVVGHGQTGFFSGVSIELLAVDIYTIPHERCSLNFAGVSEIDERTQMCASAPSFGKGPCHGDSGGPLMTQDGKQIGVVSFGVWCAVAMYPSIYSRISSEIDWINYGICRFASDPESIPENIDCQQLSSYYDSVVPEMVVRIVVRYSLRPDLTWWTVGQGDEVLYAGPEYLPYPFEQWETNFVNATAGRYTFDIRFGGDVNYGASFEIWYGALSAPSHHVLLAQGNHTRFVDEVETSEERIVSHFVIPDKNSGSFGIITAPPSNASSTTSTGTTVTGTTVTINGNPTVIAMSAEYSATVPTYNCFCAKADSSGCLPGLCHAADQNKDLCLNLACTWQG